MQIAKINVTIPEAVEEIDIGGVTLIRAAAKLVIFYSQSLPNSHLLKNLETCLERFRNSNSARNPLFLPKGVEG